MGTSTSPPPLAARAGGKDRIAMGDTAPPAAVVPKALWSPAVKVDSRGRGEGEGRQEEEGRGKSGGRRKRGGRRTEAGEGEEEARERRGSVLRHPLMAGDGAGRTV